MKTSLPEGMKLRHFKGMSSRLQEIPSHWRLTATADGSPSLVYVSPLPDEASREEGMHHRGGALSETQYIYGPVADYVFAHVPPRAAQFVSLGLGLGYNEILIASRALAGGVSDYCIASYEMDPWLRRCFEAWVFGNGDSPLTPVYEQIATGFFENAAVVRGELARLLAAKGLLLFGALHEAKQLPEEIHGYCWDAFSRKTSPELWDENFLVRCFAKASPQGSCLSTYASIGSLKRALIKSGFHLETREGFSGKKQSTWAILPERTVGHKNEGRG